MSKVYDSSVQAQQSEGVPLQQKLAVCTLLLHLKTGKIKEITLGKVGFLFRPKKKKNSLGSGDMAQKRG